jgi:hypothetical protein
VRGGAAVLSAVAGPACRLDHGGPAVVLCGLCPIRFGCTPSPAVIAVAARKIAAFISPAIDAIIKALLAHGVAHFDETGFRVAGKLARVHSASAGRYVRMVDDIERVREKDAHTVCSQSSRGLVHYSKPSRWSASRAEYNILRNFMTRCMRYLKSNGSPERFESSDQRILKHGRAVALLSYHRPDVHADAGTRPPRERGA